MFFKKVVLKTHHFLIISLHFAVTYALEAVCTYCVSVVKMGCDGVLLHTSSPSCVQ